MSSGVPWLAAELPEQHLPGLLVTIAPGVDAGDEAMIHPGQELIFHLAASPTKVGDDSGRPRR